jgi:serpin B
MDKPPDVSSVEWGVQPTMAVVYEIEQRLYSSGEAIVVLDRNYPTSMNSHGFQREIERLSNLVQIPHEIRFNPGFRAVFKRKAGQELAAANEDFAFRLYPLVANQSVRSNIIISPLGIVTALAIAYGGAAGETKSAIAKALGVISMELGEMNRAYGLILSVLKRADPKVQVVIANSLWAREGVIFKEDFLELASKSYGAEVTNSDLNTSDSIDRINRWAGEKTSGKISDIVDETILGTTLLVASAIYFKGIWHEVFRPEATKEEAFRLEAGTEKKVAMMFQEGEYKYYEDRDLQGVSLPYGHGRISMYLFLPKEEANLRKFHGSLDQDSWKSRLREFRRRRGRIGLPRFKGEHSVDLSSILRAMGMEVAFDPLRADFGGMVRTPTGVSISSIRHKAFLEVNEGGTEAAAATSIAMKEEEPSSEERFTMIVKRPFFFAIRDNEAGSVLFMGSILDPS